MWAVIFEWIKLNGMRMARNAYKKFNLDNNITVLLKLNRNHNVRRSKIQIHVYLRKRLIYRHLSIQSGLSFRRTQNSNGVLSSAPVDTEHGHTHILFAFWMRIRLVSFSRTEMKSNTCAQLAASMQWITWCNMAWKSWVLLRYNCILRV